MCKSIYVVMETTFCARQDNILNLEIQYRYKACFSLCSKQTFTGLETNRRCLFVLFDLEETINWELSL